MRHEDVPVFGSLDEDLRSDVCVVGAGIAGLTTAYLLCRAGRSVVILEAGILAAGESSRTTAHLSFALDDRYYELERLFGESGARHAYESHSRASRSPASSHAWTVISSRRRARRQKK
jgi:glycine/D-amino acid oxidase-like deaminating enzyme